VIVQSFGQLQAVRPSASFPTAPGYTPVTYWYDDADDEYAAIYADQPNIRICVDFIARNMAQLGLHAYRRKSDTDRERLTDHDTMRWLGTPNPSKTFYRLIEDLLGDMGVYFNAYWLKVRYKGKDGKAIGFVRLPPNEMTVLGGLLPSGFLWERGTKRIEFPPSEIVFFNGYNALNPLTGLSPIHTLAGLLREEAAATANRAAYWNNAARFEGVIERPREAPK
jgi:phage portal protein BeeE